MPIESTVKVFDANSDDRRSFYGTDTREALIKLGNEIGAISVNEGECRQESTSGDKGLDLVGVAHFSESDSAPGYHVIFGQCAARETEWPSKTLEAHPLRFRTFYSLNSDPTNTVFIPVSFRTAAGGWVRTSSTGGCILLDRSRILYLIENSGIGWQEIVSYDWFVNFEATLREVKNALRYSPAAA